MYEAETGPRLSDDEIRRRELELEEYQRRAWDQDMESERRRREEAQKAAERNKNLSQMKKKWRERKKKQDQQARIRRELNAQRLKHQQNHTSSDKSYGSSGSKRSTRSGHRSESSNRRRDSRHLSQRDKEIEKVSRMVRMMKSVQENANPQLRGSAYNQVRFPRKQMSAYPTASQGPGAVSSSMKYSTGGGELHRGHNLGVPGNYKSTSNKQSPPMILRQRPNQSSTSASLPNPQQTMAKLTAQPGVLDLSKLRGGTGHGSRSVHSRPPPQPQANTGSVSVSKPSVFKPSTGSYSQGTGARRGYASQLKQNHSGTSSTGSANARSPPMNANNVINTVYQNLGTVPQFNTVFYELNGDVTISSGAKPAKTTTDLPRISTAHHSLANDKRSPEFLADAPPPVRIVRGMKGQMDSLNAALAVLVQQREGGGDSDAESTGDTDTVASSRNGARRFNPQRPGSQPGRPGTMATAGGLLAAGKRGSGRVRSKKGSRGRLTEGHSQRESQVSSPMQEIGQGRMLKPPHSARSGDNWSGDDDDNSSHPPAHPRAPLRPRNGGRGDSGESTSRRSQRSKRARKRSNRGRKHGNSESSQGEGAREQTDDFDRPGAVAAGSDEDEDEEDYYTDDDDDDDNYQPDQDDCDMAKEDRDEEDMHSEDEDATSTQNGHSGRDGQASSSGDSSGKAATGAADAGSGSPARKRAPPVPAFAHSRGQAIHHPVNTHLEPDLAEALAGGRLQPTKVDVPPFLSIYIPPGMGGGAGNRSRKGSVAVGDRGSGGDRGSTGNGSSLHVPQGGGGRLASRGSTRYSRGGKQRLGLRSQAGMGSDSSGLGGSEKEPAQFSYPCPLTSANVGKGEDAERYENFMLRVRKLQITQTETLRFERMEASNKQQRKGRKTSRWSAN